MRPRKRTQNEDRRGRRNAHIDDSKPRYKPLLDCIIWMVESGHASDRRDAIDRCVRSSIYWNPFVQQNGKQSDLDAAKPGDNA